MNVTYGRDVGYVIEREDLGPEVEAISATVICHEMRGKTTGSRSEIP